MDNLSQKQNSSNSQQPFLTPLNKGGDNTHRKGKDSEYWCFMRRVRAFLTVTVGYWQNSFDDEFREEWRGNREDAQKLLEKRIRDELRCIRDELRRSQEKVEKLKALL